MRFRYNANEPMRLLVSSRIPNTGSGTSVITRRLLQQLQPDEVTLVGRSINVPTQSVSFDFPVHTLPAWRGPGDRYVAASLVGPMALWGTTLNLRHQHDAILAMFPDEWSLATGLALHRLTGLPLLPYYCDVYGANRSSGWMSAVAARLEPAVFARASRVIALNDALGAFLSSVQPKPVDVIYTCLGDVVPDTCPAPPKHDGFVVGYCGSINSARLEPLQLLAKIVREMPATSLRYVVPHQRKQLEDMDVVASERDVVTFASSDAELHQELLKCDVLSLPLTFQSDEDVDIQLKTALGTKVFDYMLSGRPVLVHAKGDTHHAGFFRDRNCGLVVDTMNPADLRGALNRLRSGLGERTRLAECAFGAAQTFKGDNQAEKLRRSVQQAIEAHEGY